MYIETNLSKIKQIADIREDENFRFRAFLKGKDGEKIDSIGHRLHKEITAQIDCTACANCCYCLRSAVSKADVNTLARLENISPEEFQDAYCETDFGGTYLKDIPCRYIDGKNAAFMKIAPNNAKHTPIRTKPVLLPGRWV
jgi:hypothetical protein